MPEVSVIIPVYNAETHLRECLDSIRNQTFANIEVICVDDGSTDESPDILAEYAASDTRFRVERQTNAGAGMARNVGLKIAGGEYLAFVDADDILTADRLERSLSCAHAESADIVVSGLSYFDSATGDEFRRWQVSETEKALGVVFPPEAVGDRLFVAFRVGIHNKLFRRAFLTEGRLEFPPLGCHEDGVFVSLALALSKRICIDPNVGYRYRKNHAGSLTADGDTVAGLVTEAWTQVRDSLTERNLLERFGAAYRHAVLRFHLDAVSLLSRSELVETFCRRLREETFPQLGVTRAAVDELSCTESVKSRYRQLFGNDVLQVFMSLLGESRAASRKASGKVLRQTNRAETLKGANEELRGANGRLRTANDELRGANGRLRTANDELRGANGRLRTANDELRGANGRLRTANDELRGANGRLRTANDELRGANGRLRTRVGELKEAMVRLRNANDDLKSDKLSLLARIRKFENETALQMLKRWVRRVLRKRHK